MPSADISLASITNSLARHDERLTNVEQDVSEHKTGIQKIEEKLDGQKNWLIGILVSIIGSLLIMLVSLLASGKIKLS